jgi:hypothetical protein
MPRGPRKTGQEPTRFRRIRAAQSQHRQQSRRPSLASQAQKAATEAKSHSKGQATTSTKVLGRSAAPTWRSGPQSKQATRLTGELISLTRTWFSVTPLQASMALVAWILLHPRVAVEIFCAARPRPGRLFDLSGSACSEVPAWELTPGWMAR